MTSHQFLQTPSQTVGPYFAYGLSAVQYGYENTQIAGGNVLDHQRMKGKRIRIRGQVFDGEGNFIPDALVEIAADAVGNYLNQNSKDLEEWERTLTMVFEFITIKPGSVAGMAPHINLMVFMRGLLVHAYSRIYFSDEGQANERDDSYGRFLNPVERPLLQSLLMKVRLNNIYSIFVCRRK
jgi:protocatechuate 3,4-dioxygenase alpha subunit